MMGKGKWHPWSSLEEFRRQAERMAGEGVSVPAPGVPTYIWAPLADVKETREALVVQVELPGVRPEQVLVEILDGDLVVRGERPFEREDPEAAYHLLERVHGAFARRFPLPPGVEGEAVSASLREGLLTITIPKAGSRAPARFTLAVD